LEYGDDKIMKTRANRHTVALAARLRAPDEDGPRRSFTSGLLMGLGAASLMLAGEFPRPMIPTGSLDDDWKAIRRDIEAATKRHGGKAS